MGKRRSKFASKLSGAKNRILQIYSKTPIGAAS